MKALDEIRAANKALRENPYDEERQADHVATVLRYAPRLVEVAELAEEVVSAWDRWSHASDDTTGRAVDADDVTRAAGEYDAAVVRLVEVMEDGQ